jgi:hypothetical protein
MIGSVTEAQAQMAAIEKKRKAKIKLEVERNGEPLTMAHAAAEGEQAAIEREQAGKAAIPGIEAEPGPGRFAEPGRPGAEQFSRPYLSTGHGARSPQSGPPNAAPIPPPQPGVLTPLQMSAVPTVVGTGPVVQGLAQHQARAAATMPPMP